MAPKPAYDADDSALLFIKDAAKFVGVHPDTLRRWEAGGHIRAIRTPTNQRRFRVSDLRALITDAPEDDDSATAPSEGAVA